MRTIQLTARQRKCAHPLAWRGPSMHTAFDYCGQCQAVFPRPATTAPWIAPYDQANPAPAVELFAGYLPTQD